jgi:hypothetical protein
MDMASSESGGRSAVGVLTAAIAVLIGVSAIAILNNSGSSAAQYAMGVACFVLALGFARTLLFRVPVRVSVDRATITVCYCARTRVIPLTAVKVCRQEELPARQQRRLVVLTDDGQGLVVSSRSFGANYDAAVAAILKSLGAMSSTTSPAHEITVEPDGSNDSGPCPCCGNMSRVVWGFIRDPDGPMAVYYVNWTPGRVEHDANVELILGEWGDGTSSADRFVVAVVLRRLPSGPQFGVIDADSRRGAKLERLADTLLRRDQVIGTPLAAKVFAILDAIWLQDGRIEELTAPPVGCAGSACCGGSTTLPCKGDGIKSNRTPADAQREAAD